MGAVLPPIERADFYDRLRADMPSRLSDAALDRLFVHYEELRRWNPLVSLVGPGTAQEVIARHYRESLAALPFLPERGRALVDVGSGGGFPGFVLAAVRPDLDVTLVEAREKKASFLETCCRKTALPCRCLNARVGSTPVTDLPDRIDMVTSRAVSIDNLGLESLVPRLVDGGGVLLWAGEGLVAPAGLEVARSVRLPGAKRRYLVHLIAESPAG